MKPVKILHMADLHLGAAFPSLIGIGAERRRELVSTFDRIVELAKKEEIDLLLIAGDLFADTWPEKALVRHVNDALASLAGIRVFIAPGNHDHVHPKSYYETYNWASNIYIFKTGRVELVEIQELGVSLWGLGWREREIHQPLLQDFHVTRSDTINILIVHGDLVYKGLGGDASPYLPIHWAELAGSGLDYVALGHLHKSFQYQTAQTVAAYPGSPEPLDFGEGGEHGVLVGTVAKGQTDLRFVPLAQRRLVQSDMEVMPEWSLAEAAEQIRNSFAFTERQRDLYRVRLVGKTDPDQPIAIGELQQALNHDFYYLEIIDDTVPDYDLDALRRQNARNALGIFLARAEEKIKQAEGRDREIWTRAMYHGLDALLGRKVKLR